MIIGLKGYKQVGKSTAAAHLEAKHGFIRVNFKDALVAEIKQNFPDLLLAIAVDTYGSDANVKPKEYIDRLFIDKPPLMRTLLQNYGTEVRRGDRDSYWTDQWEMTIAKIAELQLGKIKTLIVADDVRFANEAAAVKKYGGIIIDLRRPDITSGGTHSSETEQQSIVADYVIDCVPGDTEVLERELDKILCTQ